MSAAVMVTPYMRDLATLERYVASVIAPMRGRAVEQIDGIIASSSGAIFEGAALLEPARQIVAYADDVLTLVASARIGRADPEALATAAAAIRSLRR